MSGLLSKLNCRHSGPLTPTRLTATSRTLSSVAASCFKNGGGSVIVPYHVAQRTIGVVICRRCQWNVNAVSFAARFLSSSSTSYFKTRSTSGVGRRPGNSTAITLDEILYGSANSSNSVTNDSTSPPPDRLERERIDVESALELPRSKRKSISRILKKYKRQPHVQQQIKIAFADGYAYAEQKNSTDEKKNREGSSILAKAVEAFWLVLGVWMFYHLLNEFRGDGFSGLPGHGLFHSMGPYEVNPEDITVTFADVKGVDEAKDELLDVVEFLKDPDRFSTLGGSMPHGVLLVGEPGVGKTLLAKAVAGEAGVPFFHAAGSEFDEVFVGTGAKRVRQLFASAKERAPSVIFIDEIDSVGGKRTSSPGHPYANQTINMLLAEMDGFDKNEGVVVIGATNKRDNLDKALIRPGRFDVEVLVYPPDRKARLELLRLYLSRVTCDPEVDADKLAADTRGFVGADIDNMVNQAAIRAAQEEASAVEMKHLDWARDKVSMGPAKKSKIPDEKVNWNTALHEAGHALVAHLTPHALPLRKVTIAPRGAALGYVEQTPKDVMTNQTKAELLAAMDVAVGGKIGESLEQDEAEVTPGCSTDLTKATSIARSMVLLYGMTEAVGFRSVTNEDQLDALSDKLKATVDAEIKRLVDESYARAESLLRRHKKEHLRLAKALFEFETLDREEIAAAVSGKPLVKRVEVVQEFRTGEPALA